MSKYLKLLLLVLWMGVIFMFSQETGEVSSALSNGILIKIMNIVQLNDISFDILSFYIRKIAHFMEYAILALLVFINLDYKVKKRPLFAILFCFLYAISDEIHQYFIPMRGCSFTDVMIDTSGAVFAILIMQWIKKYF